MTSRYTRFAPTILCSNDLVDVNSKFLPLPVTGVDFVSIKPIHSVMTFQEDITTAKCRQVSKTMDQARYGVKYTAKFIFCILFPNGQIRRLKFSDFQITTTVYVQFVILIQI